MHRNCLQRAAAAIALAVLVMILGAADARAQGGVDGVVPPPILDEQPIGKTPPPSQIQPITDVIPLWGAELRERGTELPLPFGLGLTYTYINQNTVVSDVQVENQTLDLNIPDSKTTSHTALLRADVWLLPVLNVYGLIGYTSGRTRPRLVLGDGTQLETSVDYSRAMYGGGATLAFGYKSFFATVDSNYTTGAVQADKGQIGNHDLFSVTFTPRVGALFSTGEWGQGSVWVGAMWMNFKQEITDSKVVGNTQVDYSVRIEAKDPWNVLLGGNWQLNKRWSIAVEVGGILDRFQTTGAALFRF